METARQDGRFTVFKYENRGKQDGHVGLLDCRQEIAIKYQSQLDRSDDTSFRTD